MDERRIAEIGLGDVPPSRRRQRDRPAAAPRRRDPALPRGHVYSGAGWFIYVGRLPSLKPRRHPAVGLYLSLEGPVRGWDDQGRLAAEVDNMLVPEECWSPAVDLPDTLVGVAFVSPRHPLYYRLRARSAGHPLPGAVPQAGALAALLREAFAKALSWPVLQARLDRLYPSAEALPVDPRVAEALRMLSLASSGAMKAEHVAEGLCLSPDHFVKLFCRETGLTFRRYRLWSRLHHGLRSFGEGHNLTRIALEIGFSDSAHLSRTFKEVFGLRPTGILRHDGSLHVHTGEAAEAD